MVTEIEMVRTCAGRVLVSTIVVALFSMFISLTNDVSVMEELAE